jgi:hypothetical protein
MESCSSAFFDERSLFELTHPDFPDKRLIACRVTALRRRFEIAWNRELEGALMPPGIPQEGAYE